MNLTLDLAPERLARLQRTAQRTGKPIETVIEELIDTLPEEKVTPPQHFSPTEALFAQWKAEEDAMTPEEREAEALKTEEVMAALRALDGVPEETIETPRNPRRTGAELVKALRAKGLSGQYGDPALSSEEVARRLREESNRLRYA